MADVGEMRDGKLIKMEVDYSGQVDAAIPTASEMAKTGNVTGALDSLYAFEKQTRLGSDMASNSKVLVAMMKICFEAKNWQLLNDTIITLSKKRSLIKQAITKMVQEAVTFVDSTPNKETQLKLIDTLRTVTAGKIYVEVERARLTSKLVKMQEAEGKLKEACTTLMDLQVETFGSMEMGEKVAVLLEQMRLCLQLNDYVRATIISRKISTKYFQDTADEVQQAKLTFYRQMIELDSAEDEYLSICRHYRAIYDTPCIQSDEEKLKEALKCVAIYVILAPYGNEQWDLLHRIKEIRDLEKLRTYRKLLDLFTTEELIFWKGPQGVMDKYESALRRGSHAPHGVFDDATEKGRKRWEHFQTRIGEYNIRIIAKYYTQLSLTRMGMLLDWPIEKTEEFLCQMIVSGVIVGAKIDRKEGVVRFNAGKSATEVLDEWGGNLRQLTDTLNKVSHLILKEEMVHRHLHQHISTAQKAE